MSKSFINVYHAIWIYLLKPIRLQNKLAPKKMSRIETVFREYVSLG